MQVIIKGETNYHRKVIAIIVAFALLRLILSFIGTLGNDESYYWLYSQHLKSNYFDHPPLIAVWMRAFTFNLQLQNYPGFIRLGSVLSCAAASWFMFKCVSVISNQRAGFIAACLYNTSFYAGIIAGIYAFPDAPQMLFWTASLWCMACIFRNNSNLKTWILFGICSGLCIMSKVHGIFLWLGLGSYILLYARKLLLNPKLYLAIVISFIICSPILIWNIQNNFITWQFNEARITIDDTSANKFYFFKELLGQLLINNTVNFIIVLIALFNWRRKKLNQYTVLKAFNCAALLHIGILFAISLHRQTLAHWSGPAYVTLTPIAAIYLDTINIKRASTSIRLSAALFVCILTCDILFIYFFPGSNGAHSGRFLGYGDTSLDFYGWKKAGAKFDSIYNSQIAADSAIANSPLVCNNWWGAHIEYYFARPMNIKMIGLGNVMDLHEYVWLNARRKNNLNMQNAFCIVPSTQPYNPRSAYKNYYTRVDSITTIPVVRSGVPVYNFYVYKLSGWKGFIPVAQ